MKPFKWQYRANLIIGSVEIMIITDKKILVKYLGAFLLGDGCLSLSSNHSKNARYSLSQLAIHKDYVEWQASILENITSVSVWKKDAWVDKNNVNHRDILYLKTKSVPFYTTLYRRNYINGRKIVSVHDLKQFDYECMAIWMMDDGSIWINKYNNPIITLCTNNFSHGDVMLLQQMLREKFDIDANIVKQRSKKGNIQFVLRIARNEQSKYLLDAIRPYILPSFEYKCNYPTNTTVQVKI